MKVSILGYGVVGKGVYDMLQTCPQHKVCSVLVRPTHTDPLKKWLVDSIDKVLDDDSILVVECMGGVEPAFEYAKQCIMAGKGIVTANKALVTAHGIELKCLAQSKGLAFMFSAACGGAIPILQNIRLARQTDTILCAGGILNGTTNYMLDAMEQRSLSFGQALAQAQQLGYAESNPEADITGLDTFRKIALIGMVAFDALPSSGFNIEGIQYAKADDFETAKRIGRTIRLVGKTGISKEGSLYAYVQPIMCNAKSQYAGICSNSNIAYYIGKNCGLMALSGQGAGRYPTASAILRDISSVVEGQCQMLGDACMEKAAYNTVSECLTRYFVRLSSKALSAVDILVDRIGIGEVLRESAKDVCFVTKETSVEKMHRVVGEMRAKGDEIFFAEYEKGTK